MRNYLKKVHFSGCEVEGKVWGPYCFTELGMQWICLEDLIKKMKLSPKIKY